MLKTLTIRSSLWHGSCNKFRSNSKKKERTMNFMMKELASINLFIIFVIVFGGVLFLKVVKNRLED